MSVNLFSDTQTRPTPGMREAMARADVGDEQRGHDPTVAALCERVAALLGYEAAVFLPSGTMANVIAFQLHVRPGGDAILLHRDSHPARFEAGGPAALAGAMLEPLDGPRGMFDAESVSRALSRRGDRYAPRSRLLCVEQTTNVGGGAVSVTHLDVDRDGIRTAVQAAKAVRAHGPGSERTHLHAFLGHPGAEARGVVDAQHLRARGAAEG
jgi:threonine aldolase